MRGGPNAEEPIRRYYGITFAKTHVEVDCSVAVGRMVFVPEGCRTIGGRRFPELAAIAASACAMMAAGKAASFPSLLAFSLPDFDAMTELGLGGRQYPAIVQYVSLDYQCSSI